MSTIFNAIGCRVEVEKMIATGRIDMVVETTNFIYVVELKLSNNGGIDAATEQIVVSWHDTIGQAKSCHSLISLCLTDYVI